MNLPLQIGGSRRSQLRTIVFTLGALVLILGSLFLLHQARSARRPAWTAQAVSVAATVVRPQSAPATLEAVGSLRAVREVTLAPEVQGRVSALRFDAGSSVASGALLVQLFDAPERADLDAAKARQAFTGVQVARSEELAPTGAEPRELLQQRRVDRDQAAATVRQIEAHLVQKQIRAPFAGQIGIRKINLGQYLNAGDAIATLTDLDVLYVDFALPQQDLQHLRLGAQVAVATDAWPGRTFTARITTVEPRVSEDTRNVAVQALISNADHALRPGMYVTASLSLPPEPDALLVPATALLTTADGDSVIVVRGGNPAAGGKAEIVAVQLGRRIGAAVVVTRGLKPGDVVVTEGQLRVQPGADLKVASLVQTVAR